MNREEFIKVLEVCLLLWDDMPEEEVKELFDNGSVACAKYIIGFVRSYKI